MITNFSINPDISRVGKAYVYIAADKKDHKEIHPISYSQCQAYLLYRDLLFLTQGIPFANGERLNDVFSGPKLAVMNHPGDGDEDDELEEDDIIENGDGDVPDEDEDLDQDEDKSDEEDEAEEELVDDEEKGEDTHELEEDEEEDEFETDIDEDEDEDEDEFNLDDDEDDDEFDDDVA